MKQTIRKTEESVAGAALLYLLGVLPCENASAEALTAYCKSNITEATFDGVPPSERANVLRDKLLESNLVVNC